MKYEELEMTVVRFEGEDVISSSGSDTETGEY